MKVVFGRRRIVALLMLFVLFGAYPAWVLGYVWICVAGSDFPGGRNGPLDAYRHTLASAVVAHTLGEHSVEFVTTVMERSDDRDDRMDRHNNRIGSRIGISVTGFSEIEPAVRRSIQAGRVDSVDPQQSTWLPEEEWENGWLW